MEGVAPSLLNCVQRSSCQLVKLVVHACTDNVAGILVLIFHAIPTQRRRNWGSVRWLGHAGFFKGAGASV
jgi:hypothetical protein